MKIETSAGGVVYKNDNDQTLVLIARHSGHHGWVFPKGWIEKDETKEKTAIREVKEETGVEAKITHPLKAATYFYYLKGEKIKKTVYYFVMEYVSGDTNDHDWEMEEVKWLPIKEVLTTLTYPADKQVFQEALSFLK